MAFVLDASVAVGWVVAKQATAQGKRIRLRARREPYHAPSLWREEVVNALRSLERRRAISSGASAVAIDILGRMQPIIHPWISAASLRGAFMAGRQVTRPS